MTITRWIPTLKQQRRVIARLGRIGTCLLDAATGTTTCTPPDSDLPQLAAWVIGLVVIVGVGLRQAEGDSCDLGGTVDSRAWIGGRGRRVDHVSSPDRRAVLLVA